MRRVIRRHTLKTSDQQLPHAAYPGSPQDGERRRSSGLLSSPPFSGSGGYSILDKKTIIITTTACGSGWWSWTPQQKAEAYLWLMLLVLGLCSWLAAWIHAY
ncbi:protein UL15A [Panine betaherpesvirus 2]|uniref:Protein UL15A n=1 Tax=Panine betaherpesvirus 2 TaxID=188763 RepID=Q8QS72_9BETA|nr:protein UL15A [Panine betaherpesvirus 2]AAM00665.1 protein UL15A [Panine betaherpesvirus 2]QXV67767.1 protein UL15A [Panine betaherpesvirus 2]